MTTFLQAIAGPVLGIIIVVLAYGLGILISLRCCKHDEESSQSNSSRSQRDNILDPSHIHGLDIFIVSRSQEYRVSIPRPNLIVATAPSPLQNNMHAITPSQSPAPAYEDPPTYEDCVNNGFCVDISK